MNFRVGSWPGYATGEGTFVQIFLDGLVEAGCTIVSLESVEEIAQARDLNVLILHWAEKAYWETSKNGSISAKIRLLIQSSRQAGADNACGLDRT